MPSGLPPSLGAVAGTIQEHAKFIIEYLEIPAYNDASHHFQIALIDSVQALKSTYSFLQLACRPMAILLALFSRYLLMALRILSEHTIYHGIVASKELLRQSKIALFWFITSQKKLSRTAVLMELSFIGVCIGMYIIRRYLQRKKVFQKVARWYRSKKRSVLLVRYMMSAIDSYCSIGLFSQIVFSFERNTPKLLIQLHKHPLSLHCCYLIYCTLS